MTNATPTQNTDYVQAYTRRQMVFRLAMAYLALIGVSVTIVVIGVNIGQNGYFNINALSDSFVVFGGVGSFFALIGVLAVFAGLYFGVYFLAERGYSHWSAIVAIVAAIVAFIVGSLWIHIDLAFFGGAWPVVIYLVFLAAVTMAVAAILGYFRRN